ncbi:MAG: hypothetical protein H7Y86_19100 [Rhizobacter sp.]|nr:hypothetical protein [Ferruginibacter sp.]
MKLKNHFLYFKKAFFHPRVIIFMLIGTAVMFLTFLTDDNALELAISGMATVFIGIGVNNLTSLETHAKDEQKLKSKMGHTLKVMEIVQSRIKIIHQELNKENCFKMKTELGELEQILSLSIGLIKDEDSLN